MSVASARRSAEALLDEHSLATVPVNVEAVARKLGLKVLHADLGDEVSGLLVTPPTGQAHICVNRSDHPHRKRFTVGHEIGHAFLRHQFQPGEHVHVDRGNYISQRGARASTGLDPMEVEANQFAASLLMPSSLVRKAVQALTKGGPLLDNHVAKLASLFEVSEQAMAIRLQALELL